MGRLRWVRRMWIIALLLSSTLLLAQEDLGWIADALPGASDAPLDKMLRNGSAPLQPGELLLEEPFNAINAWETLTDRQGSLRIVGGRYEIEYRAENLLFWGQNMAVHENVIIQAEMRQRSTEDHNGYGLMCRADPENTVDGYYFFISGDGQYRIFRVEERQITDLVPWASTEAVRQGQADNIMTVVCHDSYLALYANGVLLAETYDTTFQQGNAGMAAAVYEPNSEVRVSFDNVRIWETRAPVPRAGEQALLEGRLSAGGSTVVVEELLYSDSFESVGSWEGYDDGAGNRILVEGDALIAETLDTEAIIYSAWNDQQVADAVLEVEAIIDSEDNANGYGVACRSAPGDTSGYYMVLSGDGYYAVYANEGDSYEALVNWERSPFIDPERNLLTAVCVDDYLALYVNGTLLVELRDTRLEAAGQFGLTTIGYGSGGRIVFDNLHVWAARLDD